MSSEKVVWYFVEWENSPTLMEAIEGPPVNLGSEVLVYPSEESWETARRNALRHDRHLDSGQIPGRHATEEEAVDAFWQNV